MTLDEFETLRLIDYMGVTQKKCAEEMEVARTTVTAIYDSARKKVADCLVNGKQLVISGGNYRLGENHDGILKKLSKKGLNMMRIAVTYQEGQIFQHFGHTEQFKIYDVTDGKISTSQIVNTMGAGHGALAGFLKNAQVDVLICGGIGGGAQMAIAEAGIQLYSGNSGKADEAVEKWMNGTLTQNKNATCDHHGHEHGHGHTCGNHSCI